MAGPISAGINNGIQFAQRASQLRLQEEQHNLKKQQHGQMKLESMKKNLTYLNDTMISAMNAPKAVGKQMMASVNKLLPQWGMDQVNESLMTSMFDPEDRVHVLAAAMRQRGIIVSLQGLSDAMTTTNAYGRNYTREDMIAAGKVVAEEKKAALLSENKSAAKDLEFRQEEKVRLAKEEIDRAESLKKSVGELSKRSDVLDKFISKGTSTLNRIAELRDIENKTPAGMLTTVNAVIGAHTLRLSQKISEPEVDSVLRNSEQEFLGDNVTLLESIKTKIKGWIKTGQKVSGKQVEAIQHISNELLKNRDSYVKDRYSRVVNSIIDQKIPAGSAKSILGSRYSLFEDNIKNGRQITDKQVQAKNTQTRQRPTTSQAKKPPVKTPKAPVINTRILQKALAQKVKALKSAPPAERPAIQRTIEKIRQRIALKLKGN